MQILIFKTNLADPKSISDLGPVLDIHPHIIQWNVDLHDIDKVLRIETDHLAPHSIELILATAGYYCKELE